MTRIYVVRHCEAISNLTRVYHGQKDCDVSENGKAQLEFLAERFKNVSFQKLYSSPLTRAKKTAQAVNKYHNFDINIDNGLIEICGGDHEGHPWAELDVIDPEQMNYWRNEPEKYSPKNGESMQTLFERAYPAVEKIARENAGETIVVATHACFIRSLVARAKGMKIEQLKDLNWVDNTSVTLIEFDDSFNPTVVFENDNTHLPQNLRFLAAKYHKNGKVTP